MDSTNDNTTAASGGVSGGGGGGGGGGDASTVGSGGSPFAPMGGHASDGLPPGGSAFGGQPAAAMASPQPPQQQQPAHGYQQQQVQQQQQQPVYGLASPPPPPQQQQAANVNIGSITRFATPGATPASMTPQAVAAAAAVTSPPTTSTGGSYASRSAQAYATQPQIQQPQPQQTLQQQQPIMPAAATSYAARSAQAQQQQQPPTSAGGGGGGGFAARSAQAYATSNQQQQQSQLQQPSTASSVGGGSYAARSAQVYAQQQAQPPPPQPSVTTTTPSSTTAGGGGYAARSAQAYTSQQQQYASTVAATAPNYGVQQPQQQQAPQVPQQQPSLQQQQQPTGATAPPAGGGGGYAARAAQAYATTNQQPQAQTMVRGGAYPHQPQQQAQPGMMPQQQQQLQPQPGMMSGQSTVVSQQPTPTMNVNVGPSPQEQASQQRMLTDATRKVQEHAYYMKQAMDQDNLPVVLDRASYMVGELGGPLHGQHHHSSNNAMATAAGLSNTGVSAKLTPKNYYELYMRALEDLPALEDYLLNLAQPNNSSSSNPALGDDQIQIILTPPPSQATTVRALPYTMRELYDCVQYCPRVVSRLYLQITAGSALIKSGEAGKKWVLNDLIQATRCEQNPIRGLFLRNFLLTALRDKLPDTPVATATTTTAATATAAAPSSSLVDQEVTAPANSSNVDETNNNNKVEEVDDIMAQGNVEDAYEFVMENFMEMNKLWVRIQHLPGEGNNKNIRKRRERERNDLRILVGTNLVRISQLEGVTSQIYGEKILPRILDHVVVVGDPLSQAYLMDCLVQVFPDEYHIETMPILLNVCPRLRDKVNIRTILQGLMDRLANYLAEEELLDESDTNQVKKQLARDSFGMFEDCVQKVYNARGPKLTSKEVIRLQTALLQFSLKVYPGNMQQVTSCMLACILALQQANASYSLENSNSAPSAPTTLDEASVTELEKLLSIPLESLALRVLEIEPYSRLISFLPFANRRGVAVQMLQAVDTAGAPPSSVQEIQQLFRIILPLIHDEQSILNTASSSTSAQVSATTSLMAGLGISSDNSSAPTLEVSFGPPEPVTAALNKECALVSKLVHLLDNPNTDVVYQMLVVARHEICQGGQTRASRTLVAVVFAALKLARRILTESAAVLSPTAPAPAAAPPTPESADDDAKANATTPKGETAQELAATDEAKAQPEEKTGDDETPEAAGKKEEAVVVAGEETTTAEATADESGDAVHDTPAADSGEASPTAADTCTDTPAAEGTAETAAATNPDGVIPPTEPVLEPTPKVVTPRKVFVFLEETISALGKVNPETAVKLFLEAALTADSIAVNDKISDFGPISYELLSQSFSFYEDNSMDSNGQHRCVQFMMGTLMACKALSTDDYETLITKTAQFSAKLVKKPSQCQMVAQAAHLFYPVGQGETMRYSNAQRALECLQRALKLADACTSSNPDHVQLFVDLLEDYLFFFEKKNPLITHAYITGLVALIKEHLNNLGVTSSMAVREAQNHFQSIIKEIKLKKSIESTAELFAEIKVDNV